MRGSLEITADILKVAEDPTNKSNIIYSANLSFEQAGRYLEKCVEYGLLKVREEKSSKEYVTTKKGREFLEAFEAVGEIVDLERDNSEKNTKTFAVFQ